EGRMIESRPLPYVTNNLGDIYGRRDHGTVETFEPDVSTNGPRKPPTDVVTRPTRPEEGFPPNGGRPRPPDRGQRPGRCRGRRRASCGPTIVDRRRRRPLPAATRSRRRGAGRDGAAGPAWAGENRWRAARGGEARALPDLVATRCGRTYRDRRSCRCGERRVRPVLRRTAPDDGEAWRRGWGGPELAGCR